MKSKYLFYIPAFIFFTLACESKHLINGLVISNNGMGTIPNAHIIKNNRPVAQTDSLGKFKIDAIVGDTLIISHLGYYSKPIFINDSFDFAKPLIIDIEMKSYEINEVKIFPFKDYNSFKQAILNRQDSPSKIAADKNVNIVREHILKGVVPKYDSYMNYREETTVKQLAMPGLNIMSSDGSVGIGAFIKAIKRRNKH